ncbi:MAG: hypothetical protein MUO76_12060, partial [Anaerolineaceae bacterium]|nr:hypothetical protein [Anaerolineaceae bacterium]
LLPGGPWALILTENGLLASNMDGSGLTQITNEEVFIPDFASEMVSPSGGLVAYVYSTDPVRYSHLTIKIYDLPSGEIRRLIPLTTAQTEPGQEMLPGDDYSPWEASGEFAWSPDGMLLAFTGLIEGPTSDLYVYSVASDEVTRLTDGPSQAYNLHWSPDSKYILHYGVDSFGTGAGYSMAGAWVSNTDGSQVPLLYMPESGDEIVYGWLSPLMFVVGSWNARCGTHNLRTVNIETKDTAPIFDYCFDSAAVDPGTGNSLVTVTESVIDWCDCGTADIEQAGVYLIPLIEKTLHNLHPADAYKAEWKEEAKLFRVADSFGQILAFRSNGEMVQIPSEVASLFPIKAPSSDQWAWCSAGLDTVPGLWIGTLQEQPRRVFKDPVLSIQWGLDGEMLLFSSWEDLFVAHAPGFEPVLVTELPVYLLDITMVRP